LNKSALELQNQANDRNDVCFHAGEFAAYLLLPVNTMDFEAKERLTCSSKTLVSQACVACVLALKRPVLGSFRQKYDLDVNSNISRTFIEN